MFAILFARERFKESIEVASIGCGNMIDKLECLNDYVYYFQFTLTGYGKDIEPNLPNKREELISTFKTLSKKIGKDKVIWRYDPILISKRYTMDYHLKAFEEIASSLTDYTDKSDDPEYWNIWTQSDRTVDWQQLSDDWQDYSK